MIVFALAMVLLKKMKKKLASKWILISLIVAFILNGIIGIWGVDLFYEHFNYLQLSLIAVNTLMGYVLLVFNRKRYFDELNWKTFTVPLISLIAGLVSFAAFSLVFNLLNNSYFGFYAGIHVLFIFLPYLIQQCYFAYSGIPEKIYKVWYLDANRKEPDFDKINVNRILLLAIEFIKHVNDSNSTNMRVKAPIGMLFGDWFQSFILNYNEKYYDNPIQYQYLDSTSMGWVFYYKKGVLRRKKYIDPDLTINQNQLSEQYTIIAERVKLTYQR